MKKKLMDFRLAIYVIIGTAVYMLSSWWAWWYGGSFGNRSMIQYYALLAFPLAACIDIALSELKRKALVFCFILACIGVNIFQVWQYEKPLIHWDSMTKEAYHAIFLSTHYPENYENLLWEPDYIGMKRNGMENGLPIDRMIYPTEELIKKDQEFSKAHEFRIAKLIEAETMTLRTHVSIYSDIVISDSLFLMSSIQTGDSLKTYPCLKITINEKELHQWKEFVFNQKVPQGPYTSKDTLKLFLWNKGKHTYRIRKFSVCNHA